MAARTTRRRSNDSRAELDPAQDLDASIQTAELVEEAESPMNESSEASRDQEIREFANVFALLSDDTRLRILVYLLQSGDCNVPDVCSRLGQPQPAVSH